jgi:hypothetical protein
MTELSQVQPTSPKAWMLRPSTATTIAEWFYFCGTEMGGGPSPSAFFGLNVPT